MERRAEYLAGSAAAAGGRIPAEGWLKTSLDKVKLFRFLVPVFLEALGPADADFYLAHCAERGPWLKALARHPFTLTQGDVRRANFAAFAPDKVSLFDWDYATRAPAALDIAWYWYLQFWCYPPADGRSGSPSVPAGSPNCRSCRAGSAPAARSGTRRNTARTRWSPTPWTCAGRRTSGGPT
jgi:hypothetical protein